MTEQRECSVYFNNTYHFHKVDECIFELSELRAANVRDQIFRATYLTQSLLREGFIGVDKPLLILGGGVAGVSSAITALHAGVTVWIFEKEPELFSKQLNITSRRIHPFEFDWPLSHWNSSAFQEKLKFHFPLFFEGGVSGNIAASWTILTDLYEELYDEKLKVFLNFDVRQLQFDISADGVQINHPHKQIDINLPTFGAAISCIGFGDEIVHDPKERWLYKGERFWANDRLAFENAAISSNSTVKILISGAGDGAMQDVLRTTTSIFGMELIEKLSTATVEAPTFAKTFKEFSECCNQIDQSAWDSVKWSDHKHKDANVLKNWFDEYETVVDKYWSQTSDEELDWQYQNIIRRDIREGNLNVTWLLSTEYFTVCYPLNRFLVSWITRLYARGSHKQRIQIASTSEMDQLDDESIMIMGVEIAKIQSTGRTHACGQRHYCSGEKHLVSLSQSNDSEKTVIFGEFHEIVIRHGVVPSPLFKNSLPNSNLRSSDIGAKFLQHE